MNKLLFFSFSFLLCVACSSAPPRMHPLEREDLGWGGREGDLLATGNKKKKEKCKALLGSQNKWGKGGEVKRGEGACWTRNAFWLLLQAKKKSRQEVEVGVLCVGRRGPGVGWGGGGAPCGTKAVVHIHFAQQKQEVNSFSRRQKKDVQRVAPQLVRGGWAGGRGGRGCVRCCAIQQGQPGAARDNEGWGGGGRERDR